MLINLNGALDMSSFPFAVVGHCSRIEVASRGKIRNPLTNPSNSNVASQSAAKSAGSVPTGVICSIRLRKLHGPSVRFDARASLSTVGSVMTSSLFATTAVVPAHAPAQVKSWMTLAERLFRLTTSGVNVAPVFDGRTEYEPG